MSDSRLQEPERQFGELIQAALEAAATLAGAAAHPSLPSGARQKCGRVSDRLMAALEADPFEVVPRSEAEALAEALEGLVLTLNDTGLAGFSEHVAASNAWGEYRSRHPKETP